ncbi:General secretion pathway protein I [Candidatus Methylobacter favarea]|uniref:General secretion pathway protein I n=1 Tax=Candidatus Methylobacter favarea TaxID=2707345 RepID=A0A8S0Y6T8_9GAMM|nr:type II secretion system protein [Candidatus Methylobacter favarea]CAA9892169.1 General secretion pathway protein I [Candidatus Methylobacter favarea]
MKKNKQAGFSLLELLIAFSILAVSLSILLKIFSTGANTAVLAEEYTAAVQIAESLMAKTGVETDLKPEESSGVENEKYHWRVSVAPFNLTMENLDIQSIPAALFKIKVTIAWDNDRQMELTTLKVINKELVNKEHEGL